MAKVTNSTIGHGIPDSKLIPEDEVRDVKEKLQAAESEANALEERLADLRPLIRGYRTFLESQSDAATMPSKVPH